jgi:hypothetical protein
LNELPIPQFQHAIQATHGARSKLRARVGVIEKFEGETVWAGEVLVFELLDHPTAYTCYAWEVDGEVTAVLHESPVGSAQEAVRAAIMSDAEH